MHDILLSTTANAGSTSGLALGGMGGSTNASSQNSGLQISGEEGSFGATLTGVFNSALSQERLDEISSQLEAMGVDSGFLENLHSFFSGNLLTLDEGQEGMSLPQLSMLLTDAISELEQVLNTEVQISELSSEQLLANSTETGNFYEGVNSAPGAVTELVQRIQKLVEPLNLSQLSGLKLPDVADSGTLSIGAGNLQSQDMKKQMQGEMTQARVVSLAGQNTPQGQQLETDSRLFSGVNSVATNINESNVSASLNERASIEQFAKLMNDQGGTSQTEAILEKFVSTGSEKTTISSLRATFSDAQVKLDSTPYSTTVMTGLNDLEWGEEIGQKIVWLTGKAIQSAEIHLNPAELGPIDVKISVQNDAAAVTFNAHNASVREMLESNVVRLREMMESNGVDLQEVNVDARQGDERFASNDQQQGSDNGQDQLEDSVLGEEESSSVEEISHVSTNLVDYFA